MLLNVFRAQTDDPDLAEAVENELVSRLYASRLSLAIGAALGMALSALLYEECPLTPILIAGLTLSVCGALRVVSFQLYSPDSKRGGLWQLIYELGALSYAGMLGLITALIILLSSRTELHLLAGVMATGYAAGAASRNTGRPRVAIGQLLLTQAPWTCALLVHPTYAHALLFVSNVLFVLVVIDLTLLMHRTVLNAFVDRQEKRQLANVYEKLSKTDPLTGLGNRMVLESDLHLQLAASKVPVAVAWLDLDQFKQVNDTLGHAAGDRLLRAVAEALERAVGGEAHIARFGGDEFVVTAAIANETEALALGVKLLSAVRATADEESALPSITASIGLSISSEGVTPDTMLRHADLALYDAKAQGRDCVRLFDPSMELELVARRALEHDFRRALADGKLELHYQPIVNLDTGRLASFEALIRWHHPVEGWVPAVTIVEMAEAIRLLEPMTSWVLLEACRAAATWPDDVSIAVNISPILVQQGDLISMVLEALVTSGLSARRLDLELTESALLEDSVQATSLLSRLQAIGVRLSLDDFGTGYSSLSYLCRYRFDTIKIDRSFTSDAAKRSEAHAVIRAISALARSMKLTVVAEGIETAVQARFVADQKCGFGQGYLFSRPVPLAQTRDLLNRDFLDFAVAEAPSPVLKLVS
jgi:diguanylate cyclase (GGDEF)-like protein